MCKVNKKAAGSQQNIKCPTISRIAVVKHHQTHQISKHKGHKEKWWLRRNIKNTNKRTPIRTIITTFRRKQLFTPWLGMENSTMIRTTSTSAQIATHLQPTTSMASTQSRPYCRSHGNKFKRLLKSVGSNYFFILVCYAGMERLQSQTRRAWRWKEIVQMIRNSSKMKQWLFWQSNFLYYSHQQTYRQTYKTYTQMIHFWRKFNNKSRAFLKAIKRDVSVKVFAEKTKQRKLHKYGEILKN